MSAIPVVLMCAILIGKLIEIDRVKFTKLNPMSSTKPEDRIWDSKVKAQFESKRPGEYMDPCQEAASKSMKCLQRNGGDREMCTDYFQAYRVCKKQWVNQFVFSYNLNRGDLDGNQLPSFSWLH